MQLKDEPPQCQTVHKHPPPPPLRPAGSASHLPALSGGSAASMMAAPEPAILVSKVLTYSDVSTEVARTGRIVLPRIQVQQCLPELLRLCRAEHALPAVRSGGPVKLSVDLVSRHAPAVPLWCCAELSWLAAALQVAAREMHACAHACDQLPAAWELAAWWHACSQLAWMCT